MADDGITLKLFGKDVSMSKSLKDAGDHAEKAGDRIKSGLGDKAKAATAALGAGLVLVGKMSIDAASDLNETSSKVEQVFGSQATAIQKWSDTTATKMGISKQSALENVGAFGTLFNQIGIGAEQSTKLSESYVQMAADWASFNNADPTEVMDAMMAAQRGEYDALQRYAPTVDSAAVATEALAQSHKKNASELTNAEKALALHTLMQKAGSQAAGDFERTSDGLANQQRIMKAQVADAAAQLGQSLLPIMLKIAQFVTSSVVPALTQMGDWFGKNSSWVLPLAAGIAGLITTLMAVSKAMALATVATQAWGVMSTVAAGITKVWGAVQAAFNLVMNAHPAVRIVLILAALVGALVLAYQKSETFRNIVDGALRVVATAFHSVMDAAKSVFSWLAEKWPTIQNILLMPFKVWWTAVFIIFTIAKTVITAVFGWIADIAKTLIGWFQSAWPILRDILTAPYRLAFAIIKVAFDAFMVVVRKVIEWVKAAWAKIKEILTGPLTLAVSGIKILLGRIVDHAKSVASNVGKVWAKVKAFVTEPIKKAVDWIKTKWSEFIDLIGRAGSSIKSSLFGLFDPLWQGFKGVINNIIGGWNRLSFSMPAVDVPGVGRVGGFSISPPNIPYLAEGGIVNRATMAVIGEAGPEAVIPLHKLPQMGGGQTINVHIPVGFVGSPAELGRALESALASAKRQGLLTGSI